MPARRAPAVSRGVAGLAMWAAGSGAPRRHRHQPPLSQSRRPRHCCLSPQQRHGRLTRGLHPKAARSLPLPLPRLPQQLRPPSTETRERRREGKRNAGYWRRHQSPAPRRPNLPPHTEVVKLQTRAHGQVQTRLTCPLGRGSCWPRWLVSWRIESCSVASQLTAAQTVPQTAVCWRAPSKCVRRAHRQSLQDVFSWGCGVRVGAGTFAYPCRRHRDRVSDIIGADSAAPIRRLGPPRAVAPD